MIIRWQGGWSMLCAADDADDDDDNAGPLDSIDANPCALNP